MLQAEEITASIQLQGGSPNIKIGGGNAAPRDEAVAASVEAPLQKKSSSRKGPQPIIFVDPGVQDPASWEPPRLTPSRMVLPLRCATPTRAAIFWHTPTSFLPSPTATPSQSALPSTIVDSNPHSMSPPVVPAGNNQHTPTDIPLPTQCHHLSSLLATTQKQPSVPTPSSASPQIPLSTPQYTAPARLSPADLAQLPRPQRTPATVFATPDEVAPLAAFTSLPVLHYEVYEFSLRSVPTTQDIEDLEAILIKIQASASKVFPDAKVVLYGSQPTGLALPASDIDLVILGAHDVVARPSAGFPAAKRATVATQLIKLSDQMVLDSVHTQRNAKVIATAKVPIIKTLLPVPHDRSAGFIHVDISMGMSSGASAVAFVQRQEQALPALRPLVLVIKAFLKHRGLNEGAQGGLSSYSLIIMVIAHLQMEGLYPSAVTDEHAEMPDFDVHKQMKYSRTLSAAARSCSLVDAVVWEGKDLGTLLMDFFGRYGCSFDPNVQGVSLRLGGVVNRSRITAQPQPGVLVLEDPQEPGHSIGAATRQIDAVLEHFRHAWHALHDAFTVWQQSSLFPVSDVQLWLLALSGRDRGHTPAESLCLGRIMNLDCALGPQAEPYNTLRQVQKDMMGTSS